VKADVLTRWRARRLSKIEQTRLAVMAHTKVAGDSAGPDKKRLRALSPEPRSFLGGDIFMAERIVVVEDNDELRYAMARHLEAAGYIVDLAHDYRDALPVLENGKKVAALVIDLILPGVNGFALARMARMRHHKVKVVYITGFENLPVNEAVGPILHKPITPDVLLTTVRYALEEPDTLDRYTCAL
jgi:CheY-like chemotaxis protein